MGGGTIFNNFEMFDIKKYKNDKRYSYGAPGFLRKTYVNVNILTSMLVSVGKGTHTLPMPANGPSVLASHLIPATRPDIS